MQDPEVLVKVWVEHFLSLGWETACQWKRKVESRESQSHSNEVFTAGCPIHSRRGFRGSCQRWSNGMKSGGAVVVIWLMRIINAVYKGGGKDHMRRDS